MLLRTALVLAVVVMANFISARFFARFYLSSDTRSKLSAHTLNVLQSITNHVVVTLYYDQSDEMYPTISALLNEYHLANPNISVQTIDYVREPAEAEKIKEQYKLSAAVDKDLVIFDTNGRFKIAPGDALVQYTLQQIPDEKELHFRHKPVAFNGEMMFTTLLLAVTNPKPFKAYCLQGEDEPSISDNTGDEGYYKFATAVAQNDIDIEPLTLNGDAGVPDDCDLLIIAGPEGPFLPLELQKIDQYLAQGGKLFALFNYYSIKKPTGLEPILQHWGVNLGYDYVSDVPDSYSGDGQNIVISSFAKHPVVDPLLDSKLFLFLPRPVSRVDFANPPPDAPEVDELAFSGPNATLSDSPGDPPKVYPLMAAVEQKAGAGITNPRGLTRIVVIGDSFAFGNKPIDSVENRDFIGYTVNWLLDQTQLLGGIGPKPVVEYKLLMTQSQQETVRWLLLSALPGGVLLLGGLVWLARRK
jgi:ABC-type uncharacterized transport system